MNKLSIWDLTFRPQQKVVDHQKFEEGDILPPPQAKQVKLLSLPVRCWATAELPFSTVPFLGKLLISSKRGTSVCISLSIWKCTLHKTVCQRAIVVLTICYRQKPNMLMMTNPPALINASPVSMGLLSTRGPPAWHPATQDIKYIMLEYWWYSPYWFFCRQIGRGSWIFLQGCVC